MQHIEELEVNEFIKFIENILYNTEQVIQEIKLDGIQNISVHIDENREVFFGRQMKGKKTTWRTQDELEKTPIYNQFRSQTIFFSEFYNKNKHIFDEYITDDLLPFQMGCEIISKVYTNVIKFDIPETNQLVILEQVSSPKMDPKRFREFQEKLQNCEPITIEFDKYDFKYDPATFKFSVFSKREIETWRMGVQPRVNLDKYLQRIKPELEQKLKELKNFLHSAPYENHPILGELSQFDIINVRLNKLPQGFPKEQKEELKKQREEILQKIQKEFSEKIKEILVYYVLKHVEEDYKNYIEGLVFKIFEGDEIIQAKLIDKEFFTSINLEQWKYISHHPLFKDISLFFLFQDLRKMLQTELKIDRFIQDIKQKQKEMKQEDLQVYFYGLLRTHTSDQDFEKVLRTFQQKLEVAVAKQIQIYEDFEKNDYKIKAKHFGKEIVYDQSHMKGKIQFQLTEYVQRLKQMLRIVYLPENENLGAIDKIQQILQLLFKQSTQEEDILKESYVDVGIDEFDLEQQDTNSTLIEGGNVFKGQTVPVKREEVEKVFKQFKAFLKEIGLDIPIILAGGQLKKPVSNDIDLQTDITIFIDKGFGNTLEEIIDNLVKLFKSKNVEQQNVKQTILSVKFPFKEEIDGEEEIKYVQIDLIIGDIEFLKEFLYQQDFESEQIDPVTNESLVANKTQFKQSLRNVLQNQILNFHPNQQKTWEDEEFEYQQKYTISFKGVREIIRQRKRGTKTWKVIKTEEKSNYTISKILSDVLGRNISFSEIDTFEKMLKLVQQTPELKQFFKEIQEYIYEYCETSNIFYPKMLIKKYLGVDI